MASMRSGIARCLLFTNSIPANIRRGSSYSSARINALPADCKCVARQTKKSALIRSDSRKRVRRLKALLIHSIAGTLCCFHTARSCVALWSNQMGRMFSCICGRLNRCPPRSASITRSIFTRTDTTLPIASKFGSYFGTCTGQDSNANSFIDMPAV